MSSLVLSIARSTKLRFSAVTPVMPTELNRATVRGTCGSTPAAVKKMESTALARLDISANVSTSIADFVSTMLLSKLTFPLEFIWSSPRALYSNCVKLALLLFVPSLAASNSLNASTTDCNSLVESRLEGAS